MLYSCNIIILSFVSFVLCCVPSRARLNFVLFFLVLMRIRVHSF
jgi:hypothetical protein